MKLRTIRIDEELWDLLKEYAELTHQNKSTLIRTAIVEKLARIQKDLFIEKEGKKDERIF